MADPIVDAIRNAIDGSLARDESLVKILHSLIERVLVLEERVDELMRLNPEVPRH